MNILITGAEGFVGKNLAAALKNIKEGRDKTHPEIKIENLYLYDINTLPAILDEGCKNADFVFHLAGVNRPQSDEDFMKCNFGFASELLEKLKEYGNTCPVMLSSSVQAALDCEYGISKKACEELFFAYSAETGAKALVYRFPNIFGKWCRPNYNSVVATFCHNIARDLPIVVNDPSIRLELLYIDDLVDEMLGALEGREHRCGDFCTVPITHKITLDEIAGMLYGFADRLKTSVIPEMPCGSFAKKLYSTYISYLPREKVAFPLEMKIDARGSFTELLKTDKCGQFSVNVSYPGCTKGQHWHNTKWELFIVVSGKGLIQQRKIGTDEILNFEVSGDRIEAVCMLPGYTHNIINLSETEPLVTLMWANEQFDPDDPDTFFETVE